MIAVTASTADWAGAAPADPHENTRLPADIP